ncbi:hypothetical protein YC2023_113100 [Brassica napus]
MSSTSSSHPQTITVLWQLRKKAVIRVRFPDNHTLEATFHPSEKLQSLADLLKRALAHTHKHVQLLPRSRSRISHKTSTLLGSFLELFSTWQTIYQKASLPSIPSHGTKGFLLSLGNLYVLGVSEISVRNQELSLWNFRKSLQT